MSTLEKIIEVLLQNGLDVNVSNVNEEMVVDSLTFMSIVIDIEDLFDVEIPAEFLSNTFETYQAFIEQVKCLLEDKCRE